MTTMPIASVIAKHVIGQECRETRSVVGTTLLLYIGPESDGNKRICLECSWRLRGEQQEILVGAIDDWVLARPILDQVSGQAIEEVEVDEVSHDLRLTFGNGLVIEAIVDSVAEDAWEFRHADGTRVGIENNSPFERVGSSDAEMQKQTDAYHEYHCSKEGEQST